MLACITQNASRKTPIPPFIQRRLFALTHSQMFYLSRLRQIIPIPRALLGAQGACWMRCFGKSSRPDNIFACAPKRQRRPSCPPTCSGSCSASCPCATPVECDQPRRAASRNEITLLLGFISTSGGRMRGKGGGGRCGRRAWSGTEPLATTTATSKSTVCRGRYKNAVGFSPTSKAFVA